MAGEGRIQPRPVDESVAVKPLPQPVLAVRVILGRPDAEVLYAGGAPTLVVGLMHLNVRVPERTRGAPVPVTVQGAAETPAGLSLRYPPETFP